MDRQQWCKEALQSLTEGGLTFESFEAPNSLAQFQCPRGWKPEWKGDHVVVRHGPPSPGCLTIYPIPQNIPGPRHQLLTAFLNEFLAPATSKLHIKTLGDLPGYVDLCGALFDLTLGGEDYTGIALATQDRGLNLIASYWVEPDKFKKAWVLDLVKVALGTFEVAPASILFPELPVGVQPIRDVELKKASPSENASRFARSDGHLAFEMDAGWQCVEGQGHNLGQYTVYPPGCDGESTDVQITIHIKESTDSLLFTPSEALKSLPSGENMRPELPSYVTPSGDGQREQQLFISYPSGNESSYTPAMRLLSITYSQGKSTLQLLALAEANRLRDLLPGLGQIAATLEFTPPAPGDCKKQDDTAGRNLKTMASNGPFSEERASKEDEEVAK